MVIVPGMQDTPSIQPKLTPEDVQLLRQLNERDRQVLGGMPRPRAADGLRVLDYVAMYSPNSQDLLFTITSAGRAALMRIDSGTSKPASAFPICSLSVRFCSTSI